MTGFALRYGNTKFLPSLALLSTHLLRVSIISTKQPFLNCSSVKVTEGDGLIDISVVLNVGHRIAALVKEKRGVHALTQNGGAGVLEEGVRRWHLGSGSSQEKTGTVLSPM